jgi:predicted PurR-regulated permease PerM
VIITILLIIAAGVLAAAVYTARFLVFLIILSIFYAYLLEPIVKMVRRPFKVRNLDSLMPRSLAIVITYIFVFTGVALAVAYLAPQIAEQAREFAESLPAYRDAIQNRIASVNMRYEQLQLSPDLQKLVNERIGSFVTILSDQMTALAGNAAITTLTYLPWLVLVPILGFFFLKDAKLYRAMFLGCFPPGRWRARAESLVTDLNDTLAGYTRAQLVSGLFIGTVCSIAFSLIGLDYALLLGIFAGILEFVPLLGPLTIGVAATLVGSFSDDPRQGIYVVIFLAALRLLHDYVTYPRIVRGGVHIHPMAVILSVLAGEQLAGIPGVFLSIPLVAVIAVVYKHLLEHTGRKSLFEELFGRREAGDKANGSA